MVKGFRNRRYLGLQGIVEKFTGMFERYEFFMMALR